MASSGLRNNVGDVTVSTKPPFLNPGTPSLRDSKNPTPILLTTSDGTTYSPLLSKAKMESLTPVPAPRTKPPVANLGGSSSIRSNGFGFLPTTVAFCDEARTGFLPTTVALSDEVEVGLAALAASALFCTLSFIVSSIKSHMDLLEPNLRPSAKACDMASSVHCLYRGFCASINSLSLRYLW